jgi:ribose 5-phosphate isomerase A
VEFNQKGTRVTQNTAKKLFVQAPIQWRKCLEKIARLASVAVAKQNRLLYEQKTLKYEISLEAVLDANDIGRVQFFVTFWRDQECTQPWLLEVCDCLAKAMIPLKPLQGIDKAKQIAGYTAVDTYVQSGMVVGLGTGSTAAYAVERIGQKFITGEIQNIACIPTSVATGKQAWSLGIPVYTLIHFPHIAVAIDGADAVDPNTLNLIKGGGGALLREKMVEVRAKKFICIVDHTKLCDQGLGPSFHLPVEITQWCADHTMRTIAKLPELAGCKYELRKDLRSSTRGVLFVTDNGNYIVDLTFKQPIKDVPAAARAIKNIPGVVEHGLFVGMASHCIVANEDGTITTMQRESNGSITTI